MKKILKENEFKIIIGFVIFLVGFSLFYYFYNRKTDILEKEKVAVSQRAGIKQPNEYSFTKMATDLIDEKCIEGTSNNYFTGCAIDLLDRKATEREWKQRKLEMWKPANSNNLMYFEGSQDKITNWRKGFEEAQYAWCDATESTFDYGTARLYEDAECKLNFELGAIGDLNYLYYEIILKNIDDNDIIADFEPTNANINALAKTNATRREIKNNSL